jgi:hypothetical protein
MITGEEQNGDGRIVTETILAGKNEEQLARKKLPMLLAACCAIFPRLAKELFVSKRPRQTGNREGEHEQPRDLKSDRSNHCLTRSAAILNSFSSSRTADCPVQVSLGTSTLRRTAIRLWKETDVWRYLGTLLRGQLMNTGSTMCELTRGEFQDGFVMAPTANRNKQFVR